MIRRILCYGDSNTWGYIPGSGKRYSKDIRWTGKIQNLLGPDFEIIEAGLNGRTTVFDDPIDVYRNGLAGLGYQLITAKPIDLLILSLGINDMNFVSANASAKGLETLIYNIKNSNIIYKGSSPVFSECEKILVIAPPPYHKNLDIVRPEARAFGKQIESEKLAHLYYQVCLANKCYYLDAGNMFTVSDIDCVHYTPENHRILAENVACKIREIFGVKNSESIN